jgi:uncharacterized protein YoxC
MKGIAIETVAFLVIAVVALILIFVFLSKTVPFISQFVESIVNGIKHTICQQIPILNMIC